MLYLKRYVVYPVFDKDAEHLVQSKKKAASMCLKQLDACELCIMVFQMLAFGICQVLNFQKLDFQ